MSAAERQHSLAGSSAGGERHAGLRAVGVAVSKLARPVLRRRGGGVLARLKIEWPMIAGVECAAVSWPLSLGRDGALKLCAASAAAIELQHRAPLLIERINLYFGRAVVARVALVQGLLPASAPLGAPPIRSLDASEQRALDARLADIADPELRAALSRLGRVVAGTQE